MILEIKGYGPHTDTRTDLSLSRRRTAPSGAGKTTMIHALCWLLWGTSPTGGRPAPLWHDGGTTVALTGKTRVERRRTPSGQIVRTIGTQTYPTEDAWRAALRVMGTDAARLVAAPMAWLHLYRETADGRHLRDAMLAYLLPEHAKLQQAIVDAEQRRRNATRFVERSKGALEEAEARLAEAAASGEAADPAALAAALDAVADHEVRVRARREAISEHAAWVRRREAYDRAQAALARWESMPDPVKPAVDERAARWAADYHAHQDRRPCGGRCPGATVKTQCARAAGDADALATWQAQADVIASRQPLGAELLSAPDAAGILARWNAYHADARAKGTKPSAAPPPGDEPTVPDAVPAPMDAIRVIQRNEAATGVMGHRERVDKARASLELAERDYQDAEAAVQAARAAPSEAWASVAERMAPLRSAGVELDVTESGCVVSWGGRPIDVASTGERIAADVAWRVWWRDVVGAGKMPILVDEAQSSTVIGDAADAEGVVLLMTGKIDT
jgi:hypothetical protein